MCWHFLTTHAWFFSHCCQWRPQHHYCYHIMVCPKMTDQASLGMGCSCTWWTGISSHCSCCGSGCGLPQLVLMTCFSIVPGFISLTTLVDETHQRERGFLPAFPRWSISSHFREVFSLSLFLLHSMWAHVTFLFYCALTLGEISIYTVIPCMLYHTPNKSTCLSSVPQKEAVDYAFMTCPVWSHQQYVEWW